MLSVDNHKHGYLIGIIQLIFIILFGIFARYADDANALKNPVSGNHSIEHGEHHGDGQDSAVMKRFEENNNHVITYPMFQDVHVMIFIGFGFLMTFLRQYGFSAVGFNFLIAAMSLQWALLVNGFFHLHNGKIDIDLNALLGADFVAAAVLISFGAIIGKATPVQLIIMLMVEIPIYVVNEVIGRRYLGAIDVGDSMFVHTFGAYFGLAVSFALNRQDSRTSKEGPCYRSDLYAMIGTIFLWLYWPSFNAAAAPGDDQHRAVINTYLSLSACCIISFAMSSLVDPNKKFNMVHIQNSTLAGGVAIGTSANLMVHPFGAVLVGIIAGIISVLGYTYLTPCMSDKLRIHDTCGVHNLHGMPGIAAGIIGVIMAAVASESSYGKSLYQIFPARAPEVGSDGLTELQKILPDVAGGSAATGSNQAVAQFLALVITFAIAIVGGLITGLILRMTPMQHLGTEDLYEDAKYWIIEDGEESDTESNGHGQGGAEITKVREIPN